MGGVHLVGTVRTRSGGGGGPSATPGDARLSAALTAVEGAPSIVEALRRIDDVRAAAAQAGAPSLDELSRAVDNPRDQVLAIAAVHGLAVSVDDLSDGFTIFQLR